MSKPDRNPGLSRDLRALMVDWNQSRSRKQIGPVGDRGFVNIRFRRIIFYPPAAARKRCDGFCADIARESLETPEVFIKNFSYRKVFS